MTLCSFLLKLFICDLDLLDQYIYLCYCLIFVMNLFTMQLSFTKLAKISQNTFLVSFNVQASALFVQVLIVFVESHLRRSSHLISVSSDVLNCLLVKLQESLH